MSVEELIDLLRALPPGAVVMGMACGQDGDEYPAPIETVKIRPAGGLNQRGYHKYVEGTVVVLCAR